MPRQSDPLCRHSVIHAYTAEIVAACGVKRTLQYVGPNVPGWAKADLHKLVPDGDARVTAMVNLWQIKSAIAE